MKRGNKTARISFSISPSTPHLPGNIVWKPNIWGHFWNRAEICPVLMKIVTFGIRDEEWMMADNSDEGDGHEFVKIEEQKRQGSENLKSNQGWKKTQKLFNPGKASFLYSVQFWQLFSFKTFYFWTFFVFKHLTFGLRWKKRRYYTLIKFVQEVWKDCYCSKANVRENPNQFGHQIIIIELGKSKPICP